MSENGADRISQQSLLNEFPCSLLLWQFLQTDSI
jgi:hypothetical protein